MLLYSYCEVNFTMGNMFQAALGIVVAVIMTVTVIVPQFITANTTGWAAQDKSLFALGTTVAVLGLIYAVASAYGMA